MNETEAWLEIFRIIAKDNRPNVDVVKRTNEIFDEMVTKVEGYKKDTFQTIPLSRLEIK